MAVRWNLAIALFVPLSTGVMLIGCSRTPRSAPPFQIGLADSDLQKTTDCLLVGIKKTVSDPTITTSAKETETGRVEEITGTSADAGELYVIRLTAENNGTKAEAFSVISWSNFKQTDLRKPLSGCVAHLESRGKGGGKLKADSKDSDGD
jgi:hypothetical protein